jgi:hypothetical protein
MRRSGLIRPRARPRSFPCPPARIRLYRADGQEGYGTDGRQGHRADGRHGTERMGGTAPSGWAARHRADGRHGHPADGRSRRRIRHVGRWRAATCRIFHESAVAVRDLTSFPVPAGNERPCPRRKTVPAGKARGVVLACVAERNRPTFGLIVLDFRLASRMPGSRSSRPYDNDRKTGRSREPE